MTVFRNSEFRFAGSGLKCLMVRVARSQGLRVHPFSHEVSGYQDLKVGGL